MMRCWVLCDVGFAFLAWLLAWLLGCLVIHWGGGRSCRQGERDSLGDQPGVDSLALSLNLILECWARG